MNQFKFLRLKLFREVREVKLGNIVKT
jgi:hypothetical protein